jgi:hypothetical protein
LDDLMRGQDTFQLEEVWTKDRPSSVSADPNYNIGLGTSKIKIGG